MENNRGFTFIEVCIVVAIVAILVAIGIPNFIEAKKSAEDKAKLEAKKTVEWEQKTANELVKQISYIRDPRTGLCFAYYRISYTSGIDSGITLIPEDKVAKIPPELIVTAELPTAEKEAGHEPLPKAGR